MRPVADPPQPPHPTGLSSLTLCSFILRAAAGALGAGPDHPKPKFVLSPVPAYGQILSL